MHFILRASSFEQEGIFGKDSFGKEVHGLPLVEVEVGVHFVVRRLGCLGRRHGLWRGMRCVE